MADGFSPCAEDGCVIEALKRMSTNPRQKRLQDVIAFAGLGSPYELLKEDEEELWYEDTITSL